MRHFRSAFSLVELSIVLAILGVVTAGGLSVGTTLVEQQANVASNSNLDEINKAIKDYYQVNGFLPCPASRTVALGGATLGTATNCGAAAAAGVVDTGAVRIGALPVRALGMRDRSIADEFGNRYIYAVTENLAIDRATFDNAANTGQITVQDGSGNTIASDVAYYVTSTGNDGKGAYRYQTAAVTTACGATTNLDVESCDDDATFRDARFNNGSVAASFYDDFPRWLPKFRLSANSGGSNTLWSNVGDNIFSVGNDGSTLTGNVGIGTMAPTNKLFISSATALDGVHMTDGTRYIKFLPGTVGAGSFSGLTQNNDNAIVFSGGAIDTGGLTIAQWSATPRGLRIDATGQIGVGTGTPQAKLDVSHTGSPAAGAIRIGDPATISNNTGLYGRTTGVFTLGAAGGDIVLDTNYGSAERMRVATSGAVSIGRTAASGSLTVFGTASLSARASTNNGIGLATLNDAAATAGNNMWFIRANANAGPFNGQANSLGFEYWGGGVLAFGPIFGSNGNVGIGSAPGADKLTVAGDVLAANYYISSDARLKHEITPAFAEAGLKILEGLKPMHFTWNNNDKKDVGVIAQDVEKVLPDAVSIDDKGFRRVAYEKLVLPVIEAVKELHKIVNDLMERLTKTEDRVSALEKENAALKARLEKLEQKLGR